MSGGLSMHAGAPPALASCIGLMGGDRVGGYFDRQLQKYCDYFTQYSDVVKPLIRS